MSTRRHPARNARRASLVASVAATAGMTGALVVSARVVNDTRAVASYDTTYDTSTAQVTTQSHGS